MFQILAFILILSAHAITHCQQRAKQEKIVLEDPITQPLPFASNGLFIFLDHTIETGDKIGLVGHELLTALDQKVGPILASSLLLRDIIKQPKPQQIVDQAKAKNDPNAQLYQTLVNHRKEIHNYLQTIPSNPDWRQVKTVLTEIAKLSGPIKDVLTPYDLDTSFEAELYQFTPSSADWIIKKVNDDLLLLIPVNYPATIKKKNNFAQYYRTGTFTERELNLGIKVDHLQDVSFDSFIDDYVPPLQRNPGAFLVDSLTTIFITREEYAQAAKQKPASFHMPQWFVYLVGHGSSGTLISDIEIDSFKKLLDFFDAAVVTKLFAYNSCYAAGVSAQNVYQDTNSPWFKTHSFTIVTGALTDAPVHREITPQIIGASDIDFEKKKENPLNYLHFNEFLQELTTQNTINFADVLSLIFPEAKKSYSVFIFGSPQIKLPGVEWFKIVDVNNNIVSIGQTLATSRSADQPLDVMEFFSRMVPPAAILLYVNVIPFELIIPQKMPILVSMIPGDSYHEFAKITVNTTLKDFFGAMKPLAEIEYSKIFLIKKLKVTGTLQDGQGDTEYENVLIRKPSLRESLDIQVTNKKNEYLEWNAQTNTLIPGNDYSFYYRLGSKETAQVEKEQAKREQAEKIRKVQERKLQAMEEGKTPAQAIQEIKEEKKQEEQATAPAQTTSAPKLAAPQPPKQQPKPQGTQPQPKPTPQAPTKEWDKQLVTFWEKLKKFLAINQNVESTEKSWFDQLNSQQWDVELPELRGQAHAISPTFDDFLEAFLTDYGATHRAVERKLLIGAVDKVGPFLFGTGPLTAEQKELIKDVMDPNSITGKKMQAMSAQRR